MKKILVLAMALAMVAVLAVPMAVFAGDTVVSGTVSACSIDVYAPSSIAFGTFSGPGDYYSNSPDGWVVFTSGTTGNSWQVTCQDASNGGYMRQSDWWTSLTNQLYVSLDNWATYATADAGVSISGSGSTSGGFTLYAKQTIVEPGDAAGDYSITITVTGSQSL
jgi:hypothetical protein